MAGPRLGPNPIPSQAIRDYIRKSPGQMPPYPAKVVSDQDVAGHIHFLRSLPPPFDLKSIPLLKWATVLAASFCGPHRQFLFFARHERIYFARIVHSHSIIEFSKSL
jgi:hypothetical protein